MIFRMRSIGVIENEFCDAVPAGWESRFSRIVIEPQWTPALFGIEGFSHIIVVFAFHRVRTRNLKLMLHPERRTDMPLVGIFSSRTSRRPNRIGIQVAELVAREGNVLTVRRLDALNGSPLLDLKPYLRGGECIPEARAPAWVDKLRETDSPNSKEDGQGH